MKIICSILLLLQIVTTNLWLSEKKKAEKAEQWNEVVMYQVEEMMQSAKIP
jgi:ornithine carbamoyltransferase